MSHFLKVFFKILPIIIVSCGYQPTSPVVSKSLLTTKNGLTIETRFPAPNNYKRTTESTSSFGHFLRNLPLKPEGSFVKYHDGKLKPPSQVYEAVFDLPIGEKDLHQCADAIMRLKALFHWNLEEYEKIHFNLTNGDRIDYLNWMKGLRIKVDGNKTSWIQKHAPSNTSNDFKEYLELIFTYAGTASLTKELESVSLYEMQIGDVFIIGGHPGHAVLVVDMAEEKNTGEKIYLLGQSYMPAQEFQLLKNNQELSVSPWYRLSDNEMIITPEWSFSKNDLKRFID